MAAIKRFDWSNLADDYQQMGILAIARKYGCSHTSVWKRLHKEGIKITRRVYGQTTIDWSRLAVDSKTMTSMEIAQRYGCQRRTVNYQLRKLRERGLLD